MSTPQWVPLLSPPPRLLPPPSALLFEARHGMSLDPTLAFSDATSRPFSESDGVDVYAFGHGETEGEMSESIWKVGRSPRMMTKK